MPFPKIKISDDDGNVVGVDTSSNALNVKLVESIDSIDIGDVSILSGDGTAITDTVSGRLDVTLRSEYGEDTGHSSGDKGMMIFGVCRSGMSTFAASEEDYSPLRIHFGNPSPGALVVCGGTKEDAAHTDGDGGIMALAVRNDDLATLSGADGDYSALQVDAKGALYTRHPIIDIGHGVTVVSTAGSHVALAGVVSCKKVDIQAQTDNTGLIAVGTSGVDATEATGTGVTLYPGDTYSFEINNLVLVYIDATVSGEGVRYTYYT